MLLGLYIITKSSKREKYFKSFFTHKHSMTQFGDICYDLFIAFIFVYASCYLTAYIYCFAMMYCHYIHYYSRKHYGDN